MSKTADRRLVVEIGEDYLALRPSDSKPSLGHWTRNVRNGARLEDALEEAGIISDALYPHHSIEIHDKREQFKNERKGS